MTTMKVRYMGTSDIRHISAKDLEGLGVTVSAEPVPPLVKEALGAHGIECKDDDLVWHRYNKWTLVMDVSERLENILRDQEVFTLSKVKDDGSVEVEAVALDPTADADKGDIVDKTTGAKSAGKRKRS